jgi:hypothetical protein
MTIREGALENRFLNLLYLEGVTSAAGQAKTKRTSGIVVVGRKRQE